MSKELSEVSIRRLKHTYTKSGDPYAAKHPVGGVKCLYLQCNPPKGSAKVGTRQWLYRATIGQERPWLGLGGYPSVPTKEAKEEARRLRALIKAGIDPRIEKKRLQAQLEEDQRQVLSFKQAAAKYVIKRSREYKTAKQTQRLRSQLDRYVIPEIGQLQVKDIERHHLIAMLEKFYERIPDSAIRIINHITVLLSVLSSTIFPLTRPFPMPFPFLVSRIQIVNRFPWDQIWVNVWKCIANPCVSACP